MKYLHKCHDENSCNQTGQIVFHIVMWYCSQPNEYGWNVHWAFIYLLSFFFELISHIKTFTLRPCQIKLMAYRNRTVIAFSAEHFAFKKKNDYEYIVDYVDLNIVLDKGNRNITKIWEKKFNILLFMSHLHNKIEFE